MLAYFYFLNEFGLIERKRNRSGGGSGQPVSVADAPIVTSTNALRMI